MCGQRRWLLDRQFHTGCKVECAGLPPGCSMGSCITAFLACAVNRHLPCLVNPVEVAKAM